MCLCRKVFIFFSSVHLNENYDVHQGPEEGSFLAAELYLTLPPPQELHLTLPPHPTIIFLYIYIYQLFSLPPQVKCQNRWGGKEFIWGAKKKLPPQVKKCSVHIFARLFILDIHWGAIFLNRDAGHLKSRTRYFLICLHLSCQVRQMSKLSGWICQS